MHQCRSLGHLVAEPVAHSWQPFHSSLSSLSLQGYCTLVLWNYVMSSSTGGVERFVKWFGRVFSYGYISFETCASTAFLLSSPSVHDHHRTVYVHRGALKALDDVFSVSRNFGIDQTHSFNLMQTVAKQKVLLILSLLFTPGLEANARSR